MYLPNTRKPDAREGPQRLLHPVLETNSSQMAWGALL